MQRVNTGSPVASYHGRSEDELGWFSVGVEVNAVEAPSLFLQGYRWGDRGKEYQQDLRRNPAEGYMQVLRGLAEELPLYP